MLFHDAICSNQLIINYHFPLFCMVSFGGNCAPDASESYNFEVTSYEVKCSNACPVQTATRGLQLVICLIHPVVMYIKSIMA